MIIIGEHGL